jgi:chitinase
VPYPPFNVSLQPSGDKWDDAAGVDQCGNPTRVGGIFDFWGLIDGGFLNADGKVAEGILYRYDNCSQTVSSFYLSQECVMLTSRTAIRIQSQFAGDGFL